jgi:hypothetical protein
MYMFISLSYSTTYNATTFISCISLVFLHITNITRAINKHPSRFLTYIDKLKISLTLRTVAGSPVLWSEVDMCRWRNKVNTATHTHTHLHKVIADFHTVFPIHGCDLDNHVQRFAFIFTAARKRAEVVGEVCPNTKCCWKHPMRVNGDRSIWTHLWNQYHRIVFSNQGPWLSLMHQRIWLLSCMDQCLCFRRLLLHWVQRHRDPLNLDAIPSIG